MAFRQNHILDTPIEYLKGVGPSKAHLLRKELQIDCFKDLLHHFPFRYIDRSQLQSVQDIRFDGQFVQLKGQLLFYEIIGSGRSKRLVVQFKDPTGSVELVWFQGISWMEKIAAQGGTYIIWGKANIFNGMWNISHPEMEKVEDATKLYTGLLPVYSTTEKLKAAGLHGRAMAKLTSALFLHLKENDIQEIFPKELIHTEQLMNRSQAFKEIHFPSNGLLLSQAIFRLKFEELLLHQIGICKLKLNLQKVKGYYFEIVGEHFNTFYNQYLPFSLTEDQKKVLREIRQDTQRGIQMNRLLQGDVGSGKTIVALLCMLLAIDNGFQACLMAPTEILAQQHYESISHLLKDMHISISFLSGSIKGKERKDILKQLAQGDIQIIIGTHALIEDKVVFKNLGISIIDEQHRFGVAQRAKLWNKNTLPPHILVMTATPIPRTLAMTSYGDLDVSVIAHLPPGRKPITTFHRTEIFRAKVMDFIKQEIQQGRQAYIVYPLIEESEKLDFENLINGYEQVKQFFPSHTYNICMVHGKMKADEKDQNMNAFVKGKAHIMVATTVIEVGVNVPNASIMLIESAERFGLSQLHQLRGRVGRGAEKSYCILLTGNKLSQTGKERMHTMVHESSGFAIAEKDLTLRGPGDIDGTRQSGVVELKLADIVKDVAIMEKSRNAALKILSIDPNLDLNEHQLLKEILLSRKDHAIWSHIS
ncbi:MAG: ATP-dependent DNA helicase RecG [Chitinophagaceae bacterium]